MSPLSPFRALALTTLALSATATSTYNRKACQKPTKDPLQGCPDNTILVGPGESFKTIQSAVLSIPNNTVPYVILMQPGNYTEQVNVTRQGPLTLLGVTEHSNDYTRNTVNVIWHNATGTSTTGTYDNAYTSTLTVAPTFNSSLTGSGPTGNTVPAGTPFGNTDFRTYNLNFINDYLPYSAGPSLAVSVSYANAGFYYTQFLSYQDTVGNPLLLICTLLLTAAPGLHRQTRQRLHDAVQHRRPNRLLLRLRHPLGRLLPRLAPWLRRRHHGLERHKHHFRQQIRRLHRRQHGSESKLHAQHHA